MNNLLIEAFWAIVQFQNLTKAADFLNVTQSTISHRLQLFEQELGFKLIERRKGVREINLTEMGEKFVPLAERWVSLSRDIELFRQTKLRKTLKIGAVTSINTYVLASFYRMVIAHIPDIDLKIRNLHSPELYDLIEQKEIDVGFTLLERHVSNVMVRPFISEPMVVLRRGRSDTIDTIQPSKLIADHELFINWNPRYLNWHDEWWHTSSSQLHLDTVQLIPFLMIDEKQWAIVPLTIARSFQKEGDFRIQYLSDPPPERVCFLITHKKKKPSVEGFIQEVSRFIQNKVKLMDIQCFL